MLQRKSTAVWRGSGLEGSGELNSQSGALKGLPYTFSGRFISPDGKAGTNPEELIGAAHAGCFAMQLAVDLSQAGLIPDELRVSANVKLEKEEGGFTIAGIHLELEGRVRGVEPSKFQAFADAAKKNCPVSRALASTPITLSARLL